MLPRLLRFIAVLLLFFTLSLPFAAGQQPDISVERGVKIDPETGEKSTNSPALPYFALIIYTMLIMTIVCMPSRKA